MQILKKFITLLGSYSHKKSEHQSTIHSKKPIFSLKTGHNASKKQRPASFLRAGRCLFFYTYHKAVSPFIPFEDLRNAVEIKCPFWRPNFASLFVARRFFSPAKRPSRALTETKTPPQNGYFISNAFLRKMKVAPTPHKCDGLVWAGFDLFFRVLYLW